MKPEPAKEVAAVDAPHVIVATEPMKQATIIPQYVAQPDALTSRSVKATDVAEAEVTPAVTQANPGIDDRAPAMDEPSLAGARHAPGVQIAEVAEVPSVEAEVPTIDPIEVKSPAKAPKRHLRQIGRPRLGQDVSH